MTNPTPSLLSRLNWVGPYPMESISPSHSGRSMRVPALICAWVSRPYGRAVKKKEHRLTSSPALPSRMPSPGTSSSNVHGSFWIQDVSNCSFLQVCSKDLWFQLTHLCICQDGVNIIVGHDDTSKYSCSVDRKVVRLRRVDNGARSRATREMGNWWRTR